MALLVSISFTALLGLGVWLLLQNYKLFESEYYNQRNIEYVEKNFKIPYKVWLEESRAKCIAEASNSSTDKKNNKNWLDSLVTNSELSNQIYYLCQAGGYVAPVTKNEVIFAHLQSMASYILIFTFATTTLAYLFSSLLVRWLPSGFRKFIRWITTNNEVNS